MANENKSVDVNKLTKDAAKTSKKFIEEFKKFALKGNVMDLAIGVIIGAAFQNIVGALTSSFINPLIALVTGGSNGEGVQVGGRFVINGISFEYGAFLTAVINFFIMALVLFLLMKGVNKLMELGKKKEEEEKAAAPAAPAADVVLLTEIRDLLKAQNENK